MTTTTATTTTTPPFQVVIPITKDISINQTLEQVLGGWNPRYLWSKSRSSSDFSSALDVQLNPLLPVDWFILETKPSKSFGNKGLSWKLVGNCVHPYVNDMGKMVWLMVKFPLKPNMISSLIKCWWKTWPAMIVLHSPLLHSPSRSNQRNIGTKPSHNVQFPMDSCGLIRMLRCSCYA